MGLKNLNVEGRLRVGFGSVMVLLLVITAIAWSASGSATSHAHQTSADIQREQSLMQLLGEAGVVTLSETSVVGDYELGAPSAAALASFSSAHKQFVADYARMTGPLAPQESALKHEFEVAFGTYVSVAGQVNLAFGSGQSSPATPTPCCGWTLTTSSG